MKLLPNFNLTLSPGIKLIPTKFQAQKALAFFSQLEKLSNGFLDMKTLVSGYWFGLCQQDMNWTYK